jgi:TM2 domain-containing membrane protein YozV
MNLPSLPFDNLYKFIAIFGLSILILSYYFVGKQHQEYFEKQLNTINMLKTKVIKDSLMAEEIEYLSKTDEIAKMLFEIKHGIKLDSIFSDYKRGKLRNEDILKIGEELLNGNKRLFEMKKALYESKIRTQEIENYNTTIQKMRKYRMNNTFIYLCGVIIGAIFSAIGFWLWYTKCQKYIDNEFKNKNA